MGFQGVDRQLEEIWGYRVVESIRRQFTRSVTSTITWSIMAIMAVALLSIFVSYWITEQGELDGQAINLSGSLRMQTYRIGLASHQQDNQALRTHLENLAVTWNSSLFAPLAQRGDDTELSRAFTLANNHWQQQVKPLFEQILSLSGDAKQQATTTLLPLLDRQVVLTDKLVYQFQLRAESRNQRLRLIQVLGLFTIVCVGSLVFYVLRERLDRPLKELTHAADGFRRGDLSQRVNLTVNDELGLLADIFNRMGDAISKTYEQLEQRVASRTRDLQQQTKALQFLLDTSGAIMSAYHTPVNYRQIVRNLGQLIHHQNIEVCLFTEEGNQPYYHQNAFGSPKDCSQRDCNDCRTASCGEDTRSETVFPIVRDSKQFGILTLHTQEAVSDWEHQLIQSTTDQIALALTLTEQKQLDRKVATLDERNVIARELHDSLAQALSYLKIQVTRLQKTTEKGRYDLQEPIITELKEGLASAYKQLRELLTTFRLKLDETGLEGALVQTIDSLQQRSTMKVTLDYQLQDIPLSPSEEIHLLQIVREAGQNAINHSEGSRLHIELCRLLDDQVLMVINDDGKGLPDDPAKLNHYGLAIMQERARNLSGQLDITSQQGVGTTIRLKFTPDVISLRRAS